ncbi:oxidoreductase domain containing [Lecanosticta acicola]|uniref:Oxidoreductase domain containing n=1 Tax=Lecanosticta acicola TaxID=111012 RepID=A0AAI8W0F2_9PEZI|nr:oxidoreductase domain containing [Lecanosticta acicola]
MVHNPTPVLPEGFLSTPAPKISVHRIDFTQTPLPEYEGLYAVICDNVLSEEECTHMLRAAEASAEGHWERAMINVGGGRQQLMTDARNCGRIIWDSREVVAKVWERIEHIAEVQEIVRLQDVPRIFGNGPAKRGEVWKFSRPNERMRFLKYEGGEYFRPHCDGSYETPDRKERSYFTLHLYLNNAGGPTNEELEEMEPADRKKLAKVALMGGATTFHSLTSFNKPEREYDVLPKVGRVLLFQHRDLLHSGADVLGGVKYTMRTDLMYALESSRTEGNKSKMPVLDDSKSA